MLPKFLEIAGLAPDIYNIHQVLFCTLNCCRCWCSRCAKSLEVDLGVSRGYVVLEGRCIYQKPTVHVECEGPHSGWLKRCHALCKWFCLCYRAHEYRSRTASPQPFTAFHRWAVIVDGKCVITSTTTVIHMGHTC